MKSESKKTVAASLETEETLLPYMPYLLQDLWGLGSSVEQIVQIFESLSFPSNKINVLDLGCGKGAVSVNLAAKWGFNVTGVDAMFEFITEANNYAKKYNSANLCNFNEADIIDYTNTHHEFDAVILASLGGVFGNYKKTINTLRNQVKAAGYIVIDDGYLKNRTSINRNGYGYCRDYETTKSELISLGDKIIAEVSTTEFSKKLNDEYLRAINERYKELCENYPKIKDSLFKYISQQKEECEFLNSELEGIIWVIQKC
jgi:ubiquinone/menaquinone biosynthesis C-methylase UbiE